MLPSQSEMFKFILEIMAEFPEFTRRMAKSEAHKKLNLTPEEENLRTSSGVLVYESRAGWAVSWLYDAGYIARVRSRTYSLTPQGRSVLHENLDTEAFNKRLRNDRLNLMRHEDPDPSEAEEPIGETSPLEVLDSAFAELQNQLSHELMTSILSIEGRDGDTFFEKIVTDLLEKMGYGKGTTTPASNDGRIDGIIKTDPLGFNPIWIQAKRYSAGHLVGKPELQAFAGALGSVTRGAFFTTSGFSAGAISFAKTYPHADIVLIDGEKLTKLMIQYGLGVSTEREIAIKKIDNDYFEQ